MKHKDHSNDLNKPDDLDRSYCYALFMCKHVIHWRGGKMTSVNEETQNDGNSCETDPEIWRTPIIFIETTIIY